MWTTDLSSRKTDILNRMKALGGTALVRMSGRYNTQQRDLCVTNDLMLDKVSIQKHVEQVSININDERSQTFFKDNVPRVPSRVPTCYIAGVRYRDSLVMSITN